MQESKEAAREKAIQVAEKLRAMKLAKAARKVEDGIEETLTYMDFPMQHWTRIRTNNAIERLNREIKRRTKAIGAFPEGQSALMLVCARLRHVAATSWGARRYMNMDHLFKAEEDQLSDIIAADYRLPNGRILILRKTIDTIGVFSFLRKVFVVYAVGSTAGDLQRKLVV